MVICLKSAANDLHMAQLMPLPPRASLKSRLVLPFWCRISGFVMEKRPLNGLSVPYHAWEIHVNA